MFKTASIHTHEIAPSNRAFLEMAVDQEHAIENGTIISKRSRGDLQSDKFEHPALPFQLQRIFDT